MYTSSIRVVTICVRLTATFPPPLVKVVALIGDTDLQIQLLPEPVPLPPWNWPAERERETEGAGEEHKNIVNTHSKTIMTSCPEAALQT